MRKGKCKQCGYSQPKEKDTPKGLKTWLWCYKHNAWCRAIVRICPDRGRV